MFEQLSSKLDKAFQSLKGEARITEVNIAETVREIRRALLMLTLITRLPERLLRR